MMQVFVKYNPYRIKTQIQINGRDVAEDSPLYKNLRGKRLQEWIGRFPRTLVDTLNTNEFYIEFYGMQLDWDDFEGVFLDAEKSGLIRKLGLHFREGKSSDESIRDRIVGVFKDLQEGPVEAFKNEKLKQAFDKVNDSVFPVNVIATMSSGKSTLINALLEKKLMPSKNEACTATITRITDNDSDRFTAVAYTGDTVLQRIPELTYEVMDELNSRADVTHIDAEGNIPFLNANDTALMLVDTPGPNNSQNDAHKKATYRAINNDSNNLILYVLNGTQLSTNDDKGLLEYVADQIQKGGKMMRDRFLFVINKMDCFEPEKEDIADTIESARNYLHKFGIDDPQIFPCSAFTALNIKTDLAGVDPDKITRAEERKLPSGARSALNMIYTFEDNPSMHLEQYSTLSPSAKKELEYRLSKAEENGDLKEQALIHCGICSIEAAITAYVKKYARTKKVKDLVETFEQVLESSKVLATAKERVATDEKAAEAARKRAEAVEARIQNGQEAAEFKKNIEALNPMDNLRAKVDQLSTDANNEASKTFAHYGDEITSREEAKRLVTEFAERGSDSIAKLATEIESAVNSEVIETGKKLLMAYQEKLAKIDESVGCYDSLDFSTADLIKGSLGQMKGNVAAQFTDEFAAKTVEDVGTVTHEDRIWYEKVGQKKEKVFVGNEQVEVGTRKVKTGSHREKVGTRSVENPDRKGFFGFFKVWQPKYIEEDVYGDVDDFKDETVYETRAKYKEVMKDVFEERHEKIEHFSVKTSDIQAGLISQYRRDLSDGLEKSLKHAEQLIKDIKGQFTHMFDELDGYIKNKYTELKKCASDADSKKAALEENRKVLAWIEGNQKEINEILDI